MRARMIVVMSAAAAALLACKSREHPAATGEATASAELAPGPWSFGDALPGTDGFPPALVEQLRAAYTPDTAGHAHSRHHPRDGSPVFTNRLLLESSPYLRQHAHNPVNWYPWGDEAFAEARRLGRPILLSVGYSTCHWCHVMADQSFENVDVARVLNQGYIAIKVDREVRPDIDAIYMAAVTSLTGGGGWPMTVWLTPDGKPFFAGTYYPRDVFLRALRSLREAYTQDRQRLHARADEVARAIRGALTPEVSSADVGPATLHSAASAFLGRLDHDHGGTLGSPKFAANMPVRFLLRYYRRTGKAEALEAADLTLTRMEAGGIYDHIGGGFHRYATDDAWRLPHFEKMLYDNALAAIAYAEAYQVSGRPDFARVVRETLRWAERDMAVPGGGFAAATDADSGRGGERGEGRFFTWTPEELSGALGRERGAAVAAYYGVTPAGDVDGRSVLHVADPATPPPPELDRAREQLYQAREKRPHPARDDKVLVDWNALMVSAFARAAIALDEPGYAERAAATAEYLWQHGRDGRGRLLHRIGGPEPGYLDDYAFLCAAFLDLFEVTSQPDWLARAIELDAGIGDHFAAADGGFYRTADDRAPLLVREKVYRDGAIPSGASVHALNLLRLHELTEQAGYHTRAARALAALAPLSATTPETMGELLLAIDFALDTAKQVAIVTAGDPAQAAPFVQRMSRVFAPNHVLVVAPESEIAARVEHAPLLRDRRALRGRTTAYVCEARACELPTADPAVFARQLGKVRPLE